MKELAFVGILIVLAGFFLLWMYNIENSGINSFEECAGHGYPVLETDPPRCSIPGGKVFFEEKTENQVKILTSGKGKVIKMYNPLPDDIIGSPLVISGEVRGFWFFEASFPVGLTDGNEKEIASGIAEAQSEWMTEEFVPFEAVLNFLQPGTKQGYLILKKDNPSGLPENDDELKIPISFK